jgi:hypothetical protein
VLPRRCRRSSVPSEQFDPVELPVQLVAEGTHDAFILERVLQHLNLHESVQIQVAGGKDKIPRMLPVFAKSSEFIGMVRAVGVVRDADEDAGTAFDSVKDAFSRSGLPVPGKSFQVVDDSGRRAGIAILPDGASRGAMETLLLDTVRGHEHMECVEQYIACSQKKTKDRHYDENKARVALLLGGFYGEYKNPMTGLALWDPASQAFEQLRSFLSQLSCG